MNSRSFSIVKLVARHYSTKPMRSLKNKSSIDYAVKFIDWKKIQCRAGNGGNGMLCFLRLFCNPKAGPSGGDGGNGSHIIFRASKNMKSLCHVPSVIRGANGQNGHSKSCHGVNAKHHYVDVPVGTTFKNMNGAVVCDLEEEGSIFIAAHGGAGGRGNNYFLSNENRHPKIAELGGIGETNQFIAELRVMAHAGLIGFPNAGKSTLLQAISRARPKVAAYPFTTLNPHIGMIKYDDHEQIAVADLPGLIEGSHCDKGLGIGFLKHVERCKCLLYVIDLSEGDPVDQFESLKYELEMYSTGLSKRPHAIIGNKIDVKGSESSLQALKSAIDLPVFPVSAKFSLNLQNLLMHLRTIYDENS